LADATQLRFANLLRRVFAIKGVDPGRTVSSNVSPTFDLSDPYHPEDRAQRGERLFGAGEQITVPLVGNMSVPQLQNDVSRGLLVVLKTVLISGLHPGNVTQPINTAHAFVGAARSDTPLGAPANLVNSKDGRGNTPGGARLTGGTRWANASLATVTRATLADQSVRLQGVEGLPADPQGFAILWDELDIVLPPGFYVNFGLRISANPSADWFYAVTFEGYQRPIDPAEVFTPP